MCSVAVELSVRSNPDSQEASRDDSVDDTLLESPLSGAPDMQVEQLDALMSAVHRLEASETRLLRRTRTLSEHLLAAERRNAGLLPAEEEIRRLRDDVARLSAEQTRLTIDVARLNAERAGLDAALRERDAIISGMLGSQSWALTAPLRALVSRLPWRRGR